MTRQGHWALRSYRWKGEPHVAVYCGPRRLGYLTAGPEQILDMARRVGATLIDLGEVREQPATEVRHILDITTDEGRREALEIFRDF